MPTRQRKAKAKSVPRRRFDFGDADDVRKLMARELDCDPADLEISPDTGLQSFREGDVWRVTTGSQEYAVVQDEDCAGT